MTRIEHIYSNTQSNKSNLVHGACKQEKSRNMWQRGKAQCLVLYLTHLIYYYNINYYVPDWDMAPDIL